MNDETDYGLERLFTEVVFKKNKKWKEPSTSKISEEEKKEIDAKKGNVKLVCSICGIETTYKELNKHKNIKIHKLKLEELKQEEKRQRSPSPFAIVETQEKSSEAKKIKEIYKIRGEYPLSELQHLYIITLSAMLALRCSLNGENQDFRLSVINSLWNEFGDIVIEFTKDDEIDEIQAIQCKQVQHKSKIPISTLGSGMGKFSIKTRCDILRKLKISAKTKDYYERAYFKIFTISTLAADKDYLPVFVYDDKILENWRNATEKQEWRNRQLKIPQYKKMSPLNTTDEPDDICIFKIVDESGKHLIDDLNRFSIFTNQLTLENLKKSIELILKNRFECKDDFSDDVIEFVKNHFGKLDRKIWRKLSKKNFVFKIAEILLQPYVAFPENILSEEKFTKWVALVKQFDVIVIKNEPEMIAKIYNTLNDILPKGAAFYKASSLITFWKERKAPIVVCTDDAKELKLIVKVISLLHEDNLTLGFIIVTNLTITRDIFQENLNVFLNWKDLEREENKLLWDDFQKDIEITFFNSTIYLSEILEYSVTFLEENEG